MAVPKRKTSRSRRDKRRTHKKLDAINVVKCNHCGEAIISHRVCKKCGHYNGREVIEIEE